MKKQIILLSLFFVFGLFLNPLQAASLDDLEICPNPNLRDELSTSQASDSSSSSGRINPLLPKGENSEALPERERNGDEVLNNSEALQEGYTCKVATVETRPDSDKGCEGGGIVQWTLVKKEGNKEIWAAHTGWGLIYVGDVEHSAYTFSEAKEVCKNKEVVINGEKIEMTLPEIGFGKGGSDIERPLNFELLKSLNYTSVVLSRDRSWFWSSSPNDGLSAWVFHPASGYFSVFGRLSYESVRCVGR